MLLIWSLLVDDIEPGILVSDLLKLVPLVLVTEEFFRRDIRPSFLLEVTRVVFSNALGLSMLLVELLLFSAGALIPLIVVFFSSHVKVGEVFVSFRVIDEDADVGLFNDDMMSKKGSSVLIDLSYPGR